MKVNGWGTAAIISDADYQKIRKVLKSKKYRLLLDIARYTGERWGAIVQLGINDIYDESWNPRSSITFRASTRKAAPSGKRTTRQVPVHPALQELLEAYRPDLEYSAKKMKDDSNQIAPTLRQTSSKGQIPPFFQAKPTEVSGWLFPSRVDISSHITLRAADLM